MAKKRKIEEESNSSEADQVENDSDSDSDGEEEEEEEESKVEVEVEVKEEQLDYDEEEEESKVEVEVEVEVKEEQLDYDEEEEDITKILEPFNKEQLIELLRTAASNDPKLVQEIHRVADSDPAHRKLFVHGLGWETTSDKLREFFSQYGELEECNVVADKITGKSKGYAFLSFKHRKGAQKALKEPQKQIESRMTACQLASAGPGSVNQQPQQSQQQPQQQQQPQETLGRKIYVGNVHSDFSSDKLYAFFSKYGEIEEGPLGFDKKTKKSKGYALFIYKSVEGAKKALEEPSKNFEGHSLHCQKATDKQKGPASGTAPAKTMSSNVPGVGAYNLPNGAMISQGSVANPMFGQGFMAAGPQFGQGVAPIQAALAVLAAAGQNPAAFGVSPASYAPLNPAMAAMPQAMQGYVMGNPGYQNAQAPYNYPYQSGPVGQAPAGRPSSAKGLTGGYMGR